MIKYAIILHFDQKLQNTENIYLATIFKVKHHMSLYISIFFAEGCKHTISGAHRTPKIGVFFFFQIYVIQHFVALLQYLT